MDSTFTNTRCSDKFSISHAYSLNTHFQWCLGNPLLVVPSIQLLSWKPQNKTYILLFSNLLSFIWTPPLAILTEVIKSAYLTLIPLIHMSVDLWQSKMWKCDQLELEIRIPKARLGFCIFIHYFNSGHLSINLAFLKAISIWINLFVSNTSFLYPLKTSGKRVLLLKFQLKVRV